MNTTLFKPIIFPVLLFFCTIQLLAQNKISYGDNKEAGNYILLNGVKHYYEVYGSGAPLLLIHGNGTGIKRWAPQIEAFSKDYKVFAIDCRGRGKTELGKDTLSYIQQAKDMAVFIKEMKMDSVYVIGRSDGAIIGLMLGIYFPDRIKKIVSFSANLQPDTMAFYPKCIEDIKTQRRNADKMLAAKDTSDNWYLVQQRNRMMEFQPHITINELHSIKAQVLVMSCDRDLIKEEHTFFIYRNIPFANLAIIPGESHHLSRQNPPLFNATVAKFLAQPFKGNAYRFDN